MYLRDVHAETDIPTLRQLIRDNPLGVLTTAIPSTSHPLIQSSHVPFLLDVADESSETELGRLRGHLARQNPQSKAIIESLLSQQEDGSRPSAVLDQEVLVLFTSPVQHYVTPRFYVDTKPATGKVVPTWNYAAAQAYGRARIYFDARADETAAFLGRQIDDLSRYCETAVMGHTGAAEGQGRPEPWAVADAPERYVELLRRNIIGVEIEIERLEGKFKMSQEMGAGDARGVVEGFRGLGSAVGRRMAEVVEERRELLKGSR
ncbi:putative transcriptional regulator [Xylariaceae sp. FL0662B]|nr:putative transcriptional regulator [Xylariaceae sp. FL0662B]